MIKKLNKLEKKLNVKFNDKQLLERSITHKSYNSKINYETLEFLGDRVIGLILSEKLYSLYPGEKEGSLDKRLAKLVNKNTCTLIGKSVNLENYIQSQTFTNNSVKSKNNIIADSCEALLGAIYIDQGYKICKKIVLKLWKNEIIKSKVTIIDPKTRLQEFSLHKYKILPDYKLESYKGPQHNPVFKISVSVNNSKKIIGTGKTKKNAEQNAAFKMMKNIS